MAKYPLALVASIRMPKVVPTYREEAKNRIVESAMQVFSEKGYHQSTMEDVAKQVGVSKGALYLYFKSKEELFNEICRADLASLSQELGDSFKKGDFLESSRRFFERTSQSSRNLGFRIEAFAEVGRNPTLRKILLEHNLKAFATVMSFLEERQKEARKADPTLKQADLRPLARALMALYDGLNIHLILGVEESELRDAWTESLKAMFAGAMKKGL
jgi:AcrR family transcriptional regulator